MGDSSAFNLRRLGWGFVIVLLDIRIGGFDLLPDAIGCILIAVSLHQLSLAGAGARDFRKAKMAAIALIFASLPAWLFVPGIDTASSAAFADVPLSRHLYFQTLTALHVLLAYWCFDGYFAIARQAGRTELLDTIHFRKNMYMILAVFQFIVYPFLLNAESGLGTLLFVLGICSLVAELLLIRIAFRLSHTARPSRIR